MTAEVDPFYTEPGSAFAATDAWVACGDVGIEYHNYFSDSGFDPESSTSLAIQAWELGPTAVARKFIAQTLEAAGLAVPSDLQRFLED